MLIHGMSKIIERINNMVVSATKYRLQYDLEGEPGHFSTRMRQLDTLVQADLLIYQLLVSMHSRISNIKLFQRVKLDYEEKINFHLVQRWHRLKQVMPLLDNPKV